MFREDVVWLIPPLLVALLQVKVIWASLPSYSGKQTEIAGDYSIDDKWRLAYLQYALYFLMWVQLIHPLLVFSNSSSVLLTARILGYFLIAAGFLISSWALGSLGDNWTGMFYYRIKKGQRLVTTGVYGFVRNPIYLATILEVVGFELVANSWLWLLLLILMIGVYGRHIVKEEALLAKKFGEDYLSYKKRVAMLIPGVL